MAKNLWVGIGCKRGSAEELLQWSVEQALANYGLDKASIAGFATLDRKAQEPGLIALAANWKLPLVGLSQDILLQIPVPHSSPLVAEKVGTASVAEAAAIVAAMISQGYFPATCAGIFPKLDPKLYPKQIYQLPHQPGMATVAIAQSSLLDHLR